MDLILLKIVYFGDMDLIFSTIVFLELFLTGNLECVYKHIIFLETNDLCLS